jgi:putative glutamine amidotransferase
MFRTVVIYKILLILLLAGACQTPDPKPVILVSKEYDNRFKAWLTVADSNIQQVSMYAVAIDSLEHYLSIASGIIISGGPDINPAIYGKASEIPRCMPIDFRRDTLEMEMIRYAMEHDIPLLCICRGHQILNAANQGSLIIDIPSDYDSTIEHQNRAEHMIRIVEGTMLSEIVDRDSGLVNSNHHQAVELVAPGFRAAAFAPDGIIEAIEFIDRKEHPFILGLQWHPEVLIRESENHPFSLPIINRFMEEVHKTER